MNESLTYAIATLLVWAGFFFALRSLAIGVKLMARVPGTDGQRLSKGLIAAGLGAVMCLLLGSALPTKGGVATTEPWRFPLVWFVMPFPAWLAVVSLVMAVTRCLQSALSLNPLDKLARFKAGLVWLVVGFVGYWLYQRDPDDKISILKGGVGLQPTTALALILLAVITTIAMVVAGREATSRGWAKTLVTQFALLVGSVIFGIPFVFLLITSFKEVDDMSSPNGIVWVPRVSQTVPYMDKKNPEYQTTYKGSEVVGTLIGKNPDGTEQFNVLQPRGLSGTVFDIPDSALKEVPRDAAIVQGAYHGIAFTGEVVEEMEDGRRRVQFLTPSSLAGQDQPFAPAEVKNVKKVGLNWKNYPEALQFLPPDADRGLVYLKNTLIIVILNVIGTILSSSIVAYAFSRMNFPGRNVLFGILLSTMMLPAAVTLLPTFLIFRDLHTIDTLIPLWVPAFFGSAFNVFLLRQFFMQIPMELEDAAKIDGCTYLKTFWDIMLPQIKPALAVIAIWTFMGAWNNFMGPLIYISSPEHMPLSYALQLFNGERSGDEPGLVMAFATMCITPVLLLFFFAQKYFIEGVTLSGLGGR
ncbi:MAG TPA: carbohydrate ABC transporter permease [Fimbriimonas sp.]|nr:carbohydrate ABC transporter permease [Fimbriimonas sp.]